VDAALAILAAMELGEEPDALRERLRRYRGIKKRFDIIQNDPGCVVIDDYGHHPTEIRATLEALKYFQKMRELPRLKAIWQPHKYTRTLDNLKGFVECFDGVDELVILPIWSAGEIEIPIDLKGAFGRYEPIMAHRVTREDGVVKVLDEQGHLLREYREGLIAAFGAGDITYQIRGEK